MAKLQANTRVYGSATIDGSLTIGGASGTILGPGNATTMKNRIINGAMVIDQRNAGASVSTTNIVNVYTLDRWSAYYSVANKYTVQQDSSVYPAGFSYSLRVTSSAATTTTGADEYSINQAIEGYNIADLDFGLSTAKTITLSFWVRSSLTGTFGGAIRNGNGTRAYPFSYTISAANTWEQKSITIPGDTTGTWQKTNLAGFLVGWSLGNGPSNQATAGAWVGANRMTSTGETQIVGTNGATFYLAGVQLEVGSTATSFEYRQYGTELVLCQRYFQTIASGTSKPIGITNYFSSTILQGVIPFKVTMRTTPTFFQVTGTNFYSSQTSGVGDTFNSFTLDTVSTDAVAWYNNSEVSGTAGQSGYCFSNNASAYLAVQAEL